MDLISRRGRNRLAYGSGFGWSSFVVWSDYVLVFPFSSLGSGFVFWKACLRGGCSPVLSPILTGLEAMKAWIALVLSARLAMRLIRACFCAILSQIFLGSFHWGASTRVRLWQDRNASKDTEFGSSARSLMVLLSLTFSVG